VTLRVRVVVRFVVRHMYQMVYSLKVFIAPVFISKVYKCSRFSKSWNNFHWKQTRIRQYIHSPQTSYWVLL